MFDESPFRERPKFLLCPRCGELLDRAFEGVLACFRCEGVWVAQATLERAVVDAPWAGSRRLWWRDELECPECASGGATRPMRAAAAGAVVFDRCPDHGMWLDRGELCRLTGAPVDPAGAPTPPDLELLRERLATTEAELDALAKRRDAWRTDLELRRKATLEYRSWLDAEHRRRTEAAEARAREAREQERQRTEEDRRREHARAVQRLGESRDETAAQLGRAEAQIIMLREQLRTAEAELDGARARLRAIDDQLDVLAASRV